MQFCSYVILSLRDQWVIERLSETMGTALVGNNLSPSPSNFLFHMKNKWLVTAQNLQSIKTLLTLEPSQYCKIGSKFSSSAAASRSRPAATASAADHCQTRKRPVFVLARPTHASRAGERPQELGRWFFPLSLWLSSGTAFGEIARWPAGAQTWAQTWTLPPDQRVVRFYRLWNHSINCVEFEFF